MEYTAKIKMIIMVIKMPKNAKKCQKMPKNAKKCQKMPEILYIKI